MKPAVFVSAFSLKNAFCLLFQKSESLPYQLKDWPMKEECDLHVQKFPTWNEFPTTYLSPENKGFVYVAL